MNNNLNSQNSIEMQPSAPPMTSYNTPSYVGSTPYYPNQNYYPPTPGPNFQSPIPSSPVQPPIQRFCGKCGAPVTSVENSFCISCGTPYSSEIQQATVGFPTSESPKDFKKENRDTVQTPENKKGQCIGKTILLIVGTCLLIGGIILATVPKGSSTPWYSLVLCLANDGYYISYNPIGQNCPSHLFQNESQSENFYISQLASNSIYTLEIAYDASISNAFIEIDVTSNMGANYMTAPIDDPSLFGVSTSTLQSGTTISLVSNGPFGIFPNCSEPCQFTLSSTLTTASFSSDTFDTASFLSSDYPITFSAEGSYFSGNIFLFRFNTGPSQGVVAGYVILFVFGSLTFCAGFLWTAVTCQNDNYCRNCDCSDCSC